MKLLYVIKACMCMHITQTLQTDIADSSIMFAVQQGSDQRAQQQQTSREHPSGSNNGHWMLRPHCRTRRKAAKDQLQAECESVQATLSSTQWAFCAAADRPPGASSCTADCWWPLHGSGHWLLHPLSVTVSLIKSVADGALQNCAILEM